MEEHAALATVDQLAHLANQAAMEVMEEMDNLANLVNVVTQLHLNHQSSTVSPNNAHAKLHQANKDQLDPKAQMDQQVMPEPQVPMVKQEIKDHVAQQAQMANKVQPAKKDQQEKLARPHQRLDQLELQVAQVKLAVQAQLVPQVLPAKMVAQAAQVAQEMLAHQAQLANQAPQAQMVMQAKQETQEAAPTAHQLVWLQDIKHHPNPFRSFHRELKLENLFKVFIYYAVFHFKFNYLKKSVRCKLAL